MESPMNMMREFQSFVFHSIQVIQGICTQYVPLILSVQLDDVESVPTKAMPSIITKVMRGVDMSTILNTGAKD